MCTAFSKIYTQRFEKINNQYTMQFTDIHFQAPGIS